MWYLNGRIKYSELAWVTHWDLVQKQNKKQNKTKTYKTLQFSIAKWRSLPLGLLWSTQHGTERGQHLLNTVLLTVSSWSLPQLNDSPTQCEHIFLVSTNTVSTALFKQTPAEQCYTPVFPTVGGRGWKTSSARPVWAVQLRPSLKKKKGLERWFRG